MLEIFVFLMGLIVGSFLNSVIYRLEKNESFLKGRSYCPKCKHTLSWSDLIPLFSFIILKGKCRYCHQKISWQYLIVEISTAAMFLLIFNFQYPIFNQFSISQFLNLIYYWLIASFLIIIFIYDLKYYIIPDKVIYPAIIVIFIYQLFRTFELGTRNFSGNWELEIRNLQSFLNPLISAIFASVFFLLIVLLSRGRGMGIGDIKLAFLMGLFLGFPNILVALFFSFLIGAIIGVGLIIAKKKTLKSEVPFGPFLITSTFLALFFGQNLINWYLHLII